MALLKVIEWSDNSGNTLVYKFPMDGKEIMMGSALTVRESQVAIFVNKGQIADIFQPGFYKLNTNNIPILTKLMSWKYGFNSPFKADVFYINTKQFPDQKWGTINPITMRDADFGMVRIRGFGKFSFKVDKPEIFLKELFGTNSSFKTEDIVNYLKSILVESISSTIGSNKISALDLSANYKNIGNLVAQDAKDDFENVGLSIVNVIVENISLPEDVEKALDKRTSLGVLGDKMGTYMQMEAAAAMREAAQNPSGGAGLVGAGVGLGAGLGIGNVFSDSFKGAYANNDQNQNTQSGLKCPKCGTALKPDAKFCPNCGTKIEQPGTMTCYKCKATISENAKFCPECGAPTVVQCVKCGHEMKAGAKFCPDCGAQQ